MSRGTPIHSIPNELLSDILVVARDNALPQQPSIKDLPNCAVMSRVTTPLRLVCARWNNVIVSTPEFWNILHFDMPVYDRLSDLGHPIPSLLLELWIKRSAGVPLHVEFWIPYPEYWVEETPLAKDIILSTAQRWRLARIALRPHSVELAPIPNLELLGELDLDVTSVDNKSIARAIPVFKSLGSSPSLCSLKLEFDFHSNSRMTDAIISCMPMAQLTRLRFTNRSAPLGLILAFASACPSLTWLALDDMDPGGKRLVSDYDDIHSKYPFPELKILEFFLNRDSDDYMEYFIKSFLSLECPKLQVFSVSGRSNSVCNFSFALDMISKCCSSTFHFLHVRDFIFDHVTLRRIERDPTKNIIIQNIPIFEASFSYPKPSRIDDVGKGVDKWVQQNPGARVTKGRAIWSMGWGDYDAAPQGVKAYLVDKNVKFRHPPL